MRIIAVANQKGGCGKTTIVINLAACLAREGQRTLAVDLDPQGHCALGLLVPEEQIEVNIADVLLADGAEGAPDMSRVTWQISSHFDLIPAKTDLCRLEQKLAGVEGREQRLARALETVRDKYDFVLIDTPPTIGFLTQSALAAAGEVVVPVDTGYFALHGLSKQLDTIRELREYSGKSLTVRILANLYDVRTKLAREILAELRKRHGDAMFKSFINFNTKLKESTSLGQPITEYDGASSGCRDFVRFARELIALETTPVLSSASGIRDEVAEPVTVSAPAISVGLSSGGAQEDLLARADALAANADKLLATSRTLLGPSPMEQRQRGPATPRETEQKIEMIYGARAVDHGAVFVVAAAGARNVRLAGSFNDWNPERTPMLPVRDGIFQARLPLPPGKYCYRYIVDGYWQRDPANERYEANPYGELNSVLVVH
jgi:chromosome partitioning protein